MIKLQVIGNLGKDCVMNTVNGKTVINFSVAHTEKFKDSQGNAKDKTIWVECAYWTDRTGISPYLKKGTQVYVEGTPEVRSYQTQDGKQGAALSLRVTNVQLLGSKNSDNGIEKNNYPSQVSQPAKSVLAEVGEMPDSDDLPF